MKVKPKERKKEREKLHEEKMKKLRGENYIPIRKRFIFDGTVNDLKKET